MPTRLFGSTSRRLIIATLLATLALTLSGCVYLRLLDVKTQLSQFDQHFVARESPEGLTIAFKNPTLFADDLTKLGLTPTTRVDTPNGQLWEIGLRKRYPGKRAERQSYDLFCQLELTDDRLTSVFVPRDYLECFPPAFIVETVKALGDSKILKLRREVKAQWNGRDDYLAPVSMATLRDTLGTPYDVTRNGAQIEATYRYKKMPPLTGVDPGAEERRYKVTFVFDAQGERLITAYTDSIHVQFTDAS